MKKLKYVSSTDKQCLQIVHKFQNIQDLVLRFFSFEKFKNDEIDISGLKHLRNLKIASNAYNSISDCLGDFRFKIADNHPGIKFEIKMTNASALLSDFFDLISCYDFAKIKAKFKVIKIDNKLSAMLMHPTVNAVKEQGNKLQKESGGDGGGASQNQ